MVKYLCSYLNKNCSHAYMLSLVRCVNFVWENKHANTETFPEWKIADKAKSYKPESGN